MDTNEGLCTNRGTLASDAQTMPPAIESCASRVRAVAREGKQVVLACEPSLEGVLCAVGIGYVAHVEPRQMRLARAREVQPRLGESVVCAPSTAEEAAVSFARRVFVGFSRHVTQGCGRRRRDGSCATTCDQSCLHRLVYAAASDEASMPEVIHQYLRLGFSVGARVRGMIADERVVALDGLTRRVLNECERTRQFVRFSHMADGSYLARFSAQADTIPLTAGHFAARMSTERFCLVDPAHRVAAFHEAGGRGCTVVRLDATLAQELASRRDVDADEWYVRAMWQRFFQGTGTPGRGRKERGYDLQASWMPHRVREGLTELMPLVDPEVVPVRYAGGGS